MSRHDRRCAGAAGVVLLVGLVWLGVGYRAAADRTDRSGIVEGLHENTPTVHALKNARIIVSPGKVLERGTLVIRDGVSDAAGAEAAPPADARVWDLAGKTIYPGLIDPYSEIDEP